MYAQLGNSLPQATIATLGAQTRGTGNYQAVKVRYPLRAASRTTGQAERSVLREVQ